MKVLLAYLSSIMKDVVAGLGRRILNETSVFSGQLNNASPERQGAEDPCDKNQNHARLF